MTDIENKIKQQEGIIESLRTRLINLQKKVEKYKEEIRRNKITIRNMKNEIHDLRRLKNG